MSIALNHRLVVPDEVLSAKVGDETVLLNLETGMYHSLDPVGTRFFELIKANGDLGAAHGAMLAEFEVSAERLEADLSRLCETMLAKGLLVSGGT
jgi:hypothetical protein